MKEKQFWRIVMKFKKLNSDFYKKILATLDETEKLFQEVGVSKVALEKFRETKDMFIITLLEYNRVAVEKLVENIVNYIIFEKTQEELKKENKQKLQKKQIQSPKRIREIPLPKEV